MWKKQLVCGLFAGTVMAGCQLPSALTHQNSALSGDIGTSGVPSTQLTSGVSPTSGTSNASPIVSNNPAALTGTVTSPDSSLISNNSAGFTEVGVGAFYRLAALAGFSVQSVAETPVAGAVVTLQSPDGSTLATSSVTDSLGQFTFGAIPGATDSVVVQAAFTASGSNFVWQDIVALSQTGAASSAVSAESTTIANKTLPLVRQGQFSLTANSISGLHSLANALRQEWGPQDIPFMATNSNDISPTFDQLLLDDATLSQDVASWAPLLAKPSRQWNVKTVITSSDLANLGIYPAGQNPIAAGIFAVDHDGNLYFPTSSASGTLPIDIYRVTPGLQASVYAQIPQGFQNPVSLAFAPEGTLFATAVNASDDIVVFSGSNAMVQETGGLFHDPLAHSSSPGRIVVGAGDVVYYASPRGQVILSKTPQQSRTVLAGSPFNPGYSDGTGSSALFRYPSSLAISPRGNLYVADTLNTAIRRVNPTTGSVVTIAGQPGLGGYRNGRGAYAEFGLPQDVAFGSDGSLYVTDAYSLRVRRLSPQGEVFLVAGTGASGAQDGPGQDATFTRPYYLAIDGFDHLYVADVATGSAPQFLIREIQ